MKKLFGFWTLTVLMCVIGWTATPSSSQSSPPPTDATVDVVTDDPSVITAWINQHFYADGDIDYSFIGLSGRQVDCISYFAQNSVRGYKSLGVNLDPMKVPPPPPLPPGVTYPQAPPGMFYDGTPDVNGNPRQCPPGDVATHRPTVTEVQQATPFKVARV